jgi:Arc/MetJ-type ribon-helix-helix transcriptional regulator
MGRIPKSGPPDEKVTVNIAPVDLGTIDLLVEEGYFSSRTDLIRTAIRKVLDENRRVVEDVATRREFVVGYVSHDKRSLELARSKGERLDVRVIGVFQLNSDVTAELADAVLERIRVLGSFRASPAVEARLGNKIARGKGVRA